MTPGEVRRLYFIIRTFLSYGLDELIPKMRITLPLRLWRYSLFWMPNRHKDKPLGERLRLALQELGPVWIKFGQMLSTRRDLFPPHIADQLALLQDKVAPFDGKLAKQQIEAAMGGLPVEAWFDDFEIKPLASASIAQVHTARLKSNGKEVVIKVIRPDILPVSWTTCGNRKSASTAWRWNMPISTPIKTKTALPTGTSPFRIRYSPSLHLPETP